METQRIIPPEPSEQLLTVNYKSRRDSALSLQKDYSKMHLNTRADKLYNANHAMRHKSSRKQSELVL